jgi:hypothetical protein
VYLTEVYLLLPIFADNDGYDDGDDDGDDEDVDDDGDDDDVDDDGDCLRNPCKYYSGADGGTGSQGFPMVNMYTMHERRTFLKCSSISIHIPIKHTYRDI